MNRRNFILGGLGTIGLMVGGSTWFINHPKFGRNPSGSRLARIKNSPHYINGHFQCLEPVVSNINNEDNYVLGKIKFFLQDKSSLFPKQPLPTQKTNITDLSLSEDLVVWMGHSTFYMQLSGKRILIDPVFSDYASPVFFVNRAFSGSNIYTANDFPEIDVLAISHDHWDHLDYASIMALKPKIREIVCPLGVGEYFEQWGFPLNILHEEDWYNQIPIDENLSVHILPTQHYSGRFTTPNLTQWCGFAFITPKRRVYCSGDGGYGEHFKQIGKFFGGFDLALMENGQYNERWQQIHLLPKHTAQACVDVGARQVITSHHGKFALALHTWEQPYLDMTEVSHGKPYQWLTPRIGEAVHIGEERQHFETWWKLIS